VTVTFASGDRAIGRSGDRKGACIGRSGNLKITCIGNRAIYPDKEKG
jgi:hypothetical protein